MKTTHTVLALVFSAALASCNTTTQSPVHTTSTSPTPTRSKTSSPAKVTPKAEGAIRHVVSPTAAPKPKAFPDIPLKEDNGTSQLIHTKPDNPSYKRSTP